MHTISSPVDDATALLLKETAEQEGREPAQVMATALRWYLRLPSSARAAIGRMESAGEDAAEETAQVVGRALLTAEYLGLAREVTKSLATALAPDASEDQIMSEAVRLITRP